MADFFKKIGKSISDTSNISVGYHTKEYGGEEEYSYTPNILMSVDGSAIYDDGNYLIGGNEADAVEGNTFDVKYGVGHCFEVNLPCHIWELFPSF